MSAIANVLTPIIPEILAYKPPATWSRSDVLVFLAANKEQYDLDDKHINAIRDNEVSGTDFLELTEEKLMKVCGLRLGPAVRITIIIRDLPRIVKPPPPLRPQELQSLPEPQLQEPQHQELYSYRVNSGTLSHSSSNRHKDLDPYIGRELQGTTKIDVGGFENIFDPNLENIDLPDPSNHSLPDWFQHGVTTFENHGVSFFKEFSDHANAKSSGRHYRGSGNKPLKDAHNASQRKADIFLIPQEYSTEYSWKYVLVVGEFKYTQDLDMDRDIVIQLASYVREIFGAQPGRRFVYAFTVCGYIARLWLFDRVGVSASKTIDISTDDGSKSFRRAMLGFMRMSASDLGIGESKFLTIQGQRYQLLEVLYHSPSIVSRGTVCWKALKCDTGEPCVVKECWRDESLTPESEYWKQAKTNEVFGCLDILASSDQESAREGFGIENNIRQKLDFEGAQNPPFKKWSTNSVANQHISTNSESFVNTTSKKRRAIEIDSRSSKRLKPTEPTDVRVKARVRNLMVMRNVGQRLETITCPRVLLEVFRDAIKCHRSLYERGKILHCDISNNNILMNTETSSIKGFLIDLDNARYRFTPNKPTEAPSQTLHSLDPKVVTGTPPFMALQLLFEHPITQTWRHDLESFLYVLIWVCTQNPFATLRQWREALINPDAASVKRDDMSNGFKVKILQQFKPEFEKVKPVVTKLRDILFYHDGRRAHEMDYTTPLDDTARIEMYVKVIHAFDQY